MDMKRSVGALFVGTAVILAAAIADAHIDISSGPGFANTTQEVTFAVGHGCAGLDTSSVKIEIPASVTSVRAETSDFGKVTFERDPMTQLITAVIWTKADQDLLPSDTNYYKLVLRFKVPNQPFTVVPFPTHQTCRGTDGGTTTVDWVATTESADGGGPEPAPALQILPARRAGWNKFTVPVAVTDLADFFGDALIVWKGNAAYSPNPTTAELIGSTSGVSKLTALAVSDEIWVKY
jgi:uncharacterized protein YcnI